MGSSTAYPSSTSITACGGEGRETAHGGPYAPEPFALVSPGKRRPYADPCDVGPFGHRDLIGSVADLCLRTNWGEIRMYGNYTSCGRNSASHPPNGGRHDNLGFRRVYDPESQECSEEEVVWHNRLNVQFVAGR